jgi:uncharacterized phiE125 gp8 family phage protein
MGVKVITPPTVEPVTLAEAKLHLRVDTSDEDLAITSMLKAARQDCQHVLQRTIAPTVLGLFLDEWPSGDVALPLGPVTTIDSVRYVDPTTGTLTTWAGANYVLDDTGVDALLRPAFDVSWPRARLQFGGVQIQYQAGWANAPESIKAWILLRLGALYRFREADSDKPASPHGFADRLLDEYRVQSA